MQRIPFNFDWNRVEGVRRIGMLGQAEGQPVNLPDDFIIAKERDPKAESGPSSGFYPAGRAAYIKNFAKDPAWEGKNVLLDIDGAYMNTEVMLNGDLLALHPYGYTPYYVDLTENLEEENTLIISTDSVQPSSRWYSGGGIYREVALLVAGNLYLHPLDVFLYTQEASAERAVVKVEAEVTNTAETKNVGIQAVFDDQVLETRTVHAFSGKTSIAFTVTLENPKLWSAENPACMQFPSA